MSEFGPEYIPVTAANVLSIPIDAGIALAGIGRIRPYAFFRYGTNHYLRAVLEDKPDPLAIWLNNRRSGLSGVRVSPHRDKQPIMDQFVRISFLYYKAQADGQPEEAYRDIAIVPSQVSIGYGTHPDHAGETPTWYFRGWHMGYSHADAHNRLTPGDEIAQPTIKNFSLARIVRGPLGDPAIDAAFRQRMGIAEIPGQPKNLVV